MTAVRPKTITGTAAQALQFDYAVAGLDQNTRRFFAHLLRSSLEAQGLWGDGFIPIPSTYIRQHFPGADWQALRDRDLVAVSPYSRDDGRAREFAINEEWLSDFVDAGDTDAAAEPAKLRDLASSKPTNRTRRSTTFGPDRNRAPDLVQRVIRLDWRSEYNVDALAAHIEAGRRAVRTANDDAARVLARRRLYVDLLALATIKAQKPVQGRHPHTRVYRVAYKPQKGGRLTEIGGGLQTCTREMKAAARAGLAGVRNYDLAASQPNLLLVLMGRAGVECDWLREYLADPTAKARLAGTVGVDVPTWKMGLLGIIMGAHVPKPSQVAFSRGKVVTALRDAAGDDFIPVYARFYDATEELRLAVDAWHDHLVDVWIPAHARKAPGGGLYVRNAAGSTVTLDSLAPSGKEHEMKATCAAFLLQGLEASVVHRIALSHKTYGFDLMSHEHDGLIVRGVVPREAVVRAADGAGVPANTVSFVEKPLA